MRRRTPRIRLCWLVLAALHLVGPAAAQIADARLLAADASAAWAVDHVESEEGCGSRRVHPEHCALCHFLLTPVDLPGGQPAFATPLADALPGPVDADPRLPAAALAGSRLPRAPPRLS